MFLKCSVFNFHVIVSHEPKEPLKNEHKNKEIFAFNKPYMGEGSCSNLFPQQVIFKFSELMLVSQKCMGSFCYYFNILWENSPICCCTVEPRHEGWIWCVVLGEGADREVIISAPLGLLSGPHERKRLTPLSLRKACWCPLCVCVAPGCMWMMCIPATIQNHLLFSSTHHTPPAPVSFTLTQRHMCV